MVESNRHLDACSRSDTSVMTEGGLLVINKPAGPSSMKIVANVRARAGGIRTGHAGTLDPLATGVLVLALGRATRSLDSIMATDKKYRTVIDLSAFTTTDDAEYEFAHAEPLRSARTPNPPARTDVSVAAPPTPEQIELALNAFTGEILQTPPPYSAIKIHGKRAYARARQGESLSMPPRKVAVHSITLIEYAYPLLTLDIHCEKGFYVRAFARAIGEHLNTGGFCRAIHRTAVGPFTIDMSKSLDQVPARISQVDLISMAEVRNFLKS
ncbi:MAG TPA: tRNA pseudouridine(55) synthase TruB [Phycisphaerales bacterium]|nr:tRNA pseudouridine(55) synthase TruB [Phycisphaerales bacterium]